MSRMCEGRVAIVTGAGRGIGREYALMLAEQGAKVVVNDLGGDRDGTGADATPAQQVVDEITAMGGEAAVNGADVSDFAAAKEMVDQAIDTFGGLDVVVNNAGILRDRMLTNMTEEEWDLVIKVHLKGTFAPARHAAAYWRERSKAGETNDARIINTTSVSGIYGNVGQTNYGAAKQGIAGFTFIAALELQRYGVTVNAIAPGALTRLTEDLGPERSEEPRRPARPGGSPRSARGWPARSRPASPGGCSSRRAGCSPSPRGGTAGPPPRPSTIPSRSTTSSAAPGQADPPGWTAGPPGWDAADRGQSPWGCAPHPSPPGSLAVGRRPMRRLARPAAARVSRSRRRRAVRPWSSRSPWSWWWAARSWWWSRREPVELVRRGGRRGALDHPGIPREPAGRGSW